MEFLKKLTRKVQFSIILIIMGIGTVAFIMGSGPDPENPEGIEKIFYISPWRKLGVGCVIVLFSIPLLGLIRDKVLLNCIYKEKIGKRNIKEITLKELCEILNLDQDVIKRKYGDRIGEKEVRNIIKSYFIK